MDFLSKTFQSLTGNSIPYTIQDPVWSNLVWKLYNGVNPKDNKPVSIFEFNATTNPDALALAQACFANSKLVKYPGIISTLDFFEISKEHLYIVTERVEPLQNLINHSSKDLKMFGVHCLASSLEFLNLKCKLVHSNLSINSVFVNREGIWKLFGFELMTPEGNMAKNAVSYGRRLVDLPEELVNSLLCNYESSIQTDSFLLGKFIQEYLPEWNSATIKRLSTKFNSRISIGDFLAKNDQIFGGNIVVRFNEELNNFRVMNNLDKLGFFKHSLGDYLHDTFVYPEGMISHKLLPELIHQYSLVVNFKPTVNTTPEETAQNQEILSTVLNYILKTSSSLSASEFSKIIPIIKTSFGSNDRSVRLILLNNLTSYKPKLSDGDIQQVFPKLVTGVLDSNFIIRELTLNSINLVVDSLTDKIINQELLKVLAKCQNDPKPSIRTNTIILIIKISSKIYKTSRNNVLITALNKSLRDSFTPCKMAALKGFETLAGDFSVDEICTKILGILAVALTDNKSSKVRNESRRLFKIYFERVESQAGDLQDEEDEELEEKQFLAKHSQTDDASKKAPASSEGGFGWNLMSKIVSSGAEGQMNNEFNKSSSTVNLISNETKPSVQSTTASVENLAIKDDWNDFDDGWGAVEDEELDIKPKPKAKPEPIKPIRKTVSSRTKTSSLKLGHKERNPGSTLKLNLVNDDTEDGWGGTDDW